MIDKYLNQLKLKEKVSINVSYNRLDDLFYFCLACQDFNDMEKEIKKSIEYNDDQPRSPKMLIGQKKQ